MTKATLLFGALLWSAWDAPLALIGGTYQNQLAAMDNGAFLANFFISIIPAAIIANWLYYKNNRSIGAAILLHAMLNAASVLLNAGQVSEVHRNGSVRGDRGRHFRHRPCGIRRGSP